MIKKTLFILASCLSLTAGLHAERSGNYHHNDRNRDGDSGCPATVQSGPCVCYCPMTAYKPVYYCEEKCVPETYTVQKKCCRYVPEYYTKEHCRYVPQYYTKTYCRQVPEYYCVDEEKCRTKTVKVDKCRYEPYCYVEKKCLDCPSTGCAVDNGSSSYSSRNSSRNRNNNYDYDYSSKTSKNNRSNVAQSEHTSRK